MKKIKTNCIGKILSFALSIFCIFSISSFSPFVQVAHAELSINYSDSTSFTPVPVYIRAKSGVPVGTIAVWSKAVIPEGWLECDGQAVSSTYPELKALMPRVPNYQGMFLRGDGNQLVGHGTYGSVTHESAALGEVQGDSIRNVKAEIKQPFLLPQGGVTGAFETIYQPNAQTIRYEIPRNYNVGVRLNFSKAVPTSEENRPVNVAVKYIIKAE